MTYEIFDWEVESKDIDSFWDITELEQREFYQTLLRTATFARCFNPRYNITNQFWDYIDAKTKGQDHVIIVLIGRTGSGKSRVAQIIAKRIYPKLWIEDVVFTNEELLTRSEKASRNSIIIQDEQVVLMGIGSEREKAEVGNIEMVMRKFGLSLVFCSPVEFPHETAHIKMEVLCKNKEKRLTKVALLDKKNNYLGYVIFKVPEDADDPLWRIYEETNTGKKDKFIDDLKKRQMQRIDYKAKAEKIMDHELWKRYKHKIGDQTLYYIIREQNPQLADKEIKTIYTAYYNYFQKKNNKTLTMEEVQSECTHTTRRFNKTKGQVLCRACGIVIASNKSL